jgi:antitoxin PrlF
VNRLEIGLSTRHLIAMSRRRFTSRLTSRSRTIIPAAVREKLGIGPGDVSRYIETVDGILIEKARTREDDPFATFSEWATEADDEAYADH